jgi:hypothetical protein
MPIAAIRPNSWKAGKPELAITTKALTVVAGGDQQRRDEAAEGAADRLVLGVLGELAADAGEEVDPRVDADADQDGGDQRGDRVEVTEDDLSEAHRPGDAAEQGQEQREDRAEGAEEDEEDDEHAEQAGGAAAPRRRG